MIGRKNRDVKFIIYQSLYIFVISVLALKGANLDLTEVVKKEKEDKKVTDIYVDSLKTVIDSLLAKGIVPELKFDTSKKFTDIEELKKELAVRQKQLAEMRVTISSSPSFSVNQTSPNLSVTNPDKEALTEKKKSEDETEEKEQKQNVEFRVPQSFTQYTTNSVSNPSDEPIEIYGSDGSMLASVPPRGSRTFTLGGQTSLTFKRGGVSKTVSTRENQRPKLVLQRLVDAGENVSIRKLQSTVGYRVTINDDFPEQLDVNFSGPVTVKQVGTMVYDVTLNFLTSKDAFDRYTENRDPPYPINFTVTVKDKVASQQVVRQLGTFQFGEW